jgi:hypothetical protein
MTFQTFLKAAVALRILKCRSPCIDSCKHFFKADSQVSSFQYGKKESTAPHVGDRGKGRHNIALAIYGYLICVCLGNIRQLFVFISFCYAEVQYSVSETSC